MLYLVNSSRVVIYFLWKWSLVKWDFVCQPKNEGGLGLQSAVLHSQVLVAKLYWRWCSNQHQLWARILTQKYLGSIDSWNVPHCQLEGRGSVICHTLKVGAQLIKRGNFWICNKGSETLFWLDSWDGNPPILSMYPHLQLLYDILVAASWTMVGHYKSIKIFGSTVGYRWKDPSEWPLGGLEDSWKELAHILSSQECNSLAGLDILA